MMTIVLAALYLVVGCLVFAVAQRQRRQAGVSAFTAGLLWPFLLPTLLQEPSPLRTTTSPRAARLDEAVSTLREAWDRGATAWSSGTKERERLEAFIARLRTTESRLTEIDMALQRGPASVRERLEHLRERALVELEQGLAMLEELAAQLTLLRFAHVGESAERAHLEGLLARIGALAEVTVDSGRRSESAHSAGGILSTSLPR